MPALLPAGTRSLPPLGGGLFLAYRLLWWLLLVSAVAAAGASLFDGGTHPVIQMLRLAKSGVLVAVATILFRRRRRDPVAALVGLSFLLWTISSSVDFAGSATTTWSLLIDRLRFVLFALALLFFPDGKWQPLRAGPIAAAIFTVFLVGVVEAVGLLATQLYLPLAISCVLAAMASLLVRYRSLDETTQQQLKWIALGLVAGIGLILSARAGAALIVTGAKPMAGNLLLEGLFQSGVVIIALGFLTSLLRYRLYDAETAISRSAAYAGLTLALVGTFAASEAVIQTVGQRYFGSGIGDLSGGIAAAVAAVLLTPLHSKISGWAEQYFQHDLAALKQELPDLLVTLSAGGSVERLAAAVLPRIEEAVQSTRTAVIVDNRLVATQGISLASVRKLLKGWQPPAIAGPISRDDGDAFPLHMALRCPLGSVRGWLLLGPRPDGSYYGRDDVEALTAIAPSLQLALFQVSEREKETSRRSVDYRDLRRTLRLVSARLSALEQLTASGTFPAQSW